MITDLMPHELLKSYISKYSFVRLSSIYSQERCVPDGAVKLFLYESDYRICYHTDTGKTLNWKDGAGGHPLSSHYSMQIRQPIQLTICYFKASAFYQLFRIPIRLLNDDVIPLEEILGEQANPLKDRLANTPNLYSKKDLLDQFFLETLSRRQLSEPKGIAFLEQVILQKGGNIRLDVLLQETDLSLRSVERLFWEYVGMSPKQFCKVIRFNQAFLLRKNNPHISWQEIVFHCGYYDQSHYISEFRSYMGVSPQKFDGGNTGISSIYVGNYIDGLPSH
ncbi:MAG TPA: helix-turn-helix transcriptional regulator [Sphingobacterium sp.]|nr:helix-turn-helix transcriptional regulator [Sphingobacterium sp.]